MVSVERIGVKPNKEKCQWRFSQPNGLAMGKPDITDNPVNYLPGERAGHGGLALGLRTMQDCIAQKGEPWPCKRNRNA